MSAKFDRPMKLWDMVTEIVGVYDRMQGVKVPRVHARGYEFYQTPTLLTPHGRIGVALSDAELELAWYDAHPKIGNRVKVTRDHGAYRVEVLA